MIIRFNRNEITPFETSVVNYLIHVVENNPNLDWYQVDTSFLDSFLVRGNEELWKATYYTIRKQLRVNPDDINGYSITPKWLKDLFIEYRQGLNKDVWTPNKICLETVEKIEKENVKEDNPKKSYKWEFAYSTNDDNTLHTVKFPEYATDDYIDGFLKGAGATKLYKIVKEEIKKC